MTLPITLPVTPSSPSSDNIKKLESNNPTPRTPVSPTMPNQQQASPSQQQPKRKPSRRANTAERRATHNAVERQRRETLNGRFLDLAALLPNLSQIRRPSKSSIVNSSIAHIHASRRHRILASRELRLLKLEADALRRELNEWRERAGIPLVEEPVRGDGFAMVIGGELEVIVGVPGNNSGDDPEEDDDAMDGVTGGTGGAGSYGGYVGGDGVLNDDDFAVVASPTIDSSSGLNIDPTTSSPIVPTTASALDDPRVLAMLKQQQQQQQGGGGQFPHHIPHHHSMSSGGSGLPPSLMPRPGASGATNVPASFEALYDQYSSHHPTMQHQPHHHPQQIPFTHQQAMLHHHQQQQNAYLQQQQQQHFRERERSGSVSGQNGRDQQQREFRERERMMAVKPHQQVKPPVQQQDWGLYGPAPPNSVHPSQQQLNFQYPLQASSSSSVDGNQQMMSLLQAQAAQRSLFTPPATSHGLPTPSPTNSNPTTHAGHGGLHMNGHGHGSINTTNLGGAGGGGSVPASPTSLVSSPVGPSPVGQVVAMGRERSGSVHSLVSVHSVHSASSPGGSVVSGSASGSTGRGSHSPAYELGMGVVDYLSVAAGGEGQQQQQQQQQGELVPRMGGVNHHHHAANGMMGFHGMGMEMMVGVVDGM